MQPQSKHALQSAGIILADSRLRLAVTFLSRLLLKILMPTWQQPDSVPNIRSSHPTGNPDPTTQPPPFLLKNGGFLFNRMQPPEYRLKQFLVHRLADQIIGDIHLPDRESRYLRVFFPSGIPFCSNNTSDAKDGKAPASATSEKASNSFIMRK